MTVCSECGLPDCRNCYPAVPVLAPSPEEIEAELVKFREAKDAKRGDIDKPVDIHEYGLRRRGSDCEWKVQ